MKGTPHKLYQAYSDCMVRLPVITDKGDHASGAAFHIGGGCLATARHNLSDAQLQVDELGLEVRELFFPEDPTVDLAILQTNFGGDPEHYVRLGGHLDDWIDSQFILSRALLMGYPPIPRALHAELVAVSVEVNAIVDRYDGPHPHFIISAIPRGGFSGGPVFSEWGFLLGVMTASLFDGSKPSELGFAAAITVEPLLKLIHSSQAPCLSNLAWANYFCGDGPVPADAPPELRDP